MNPSRPLCLVIEDDEDLRTLLCLILTSEGFEVHTEATGAGGLDAVGRLNPTLITLYLGLPDMDGRDVARDLRRQSAATLLMITGRTSTDDELESIASGASAYLTKPFHPARLRAIIQQLFPPAPRQE